MQQKIDLHPSRVEAEAERGTVVKIAVQRHIRPVRVDVIVPTGQLGDDRIRIRIVEPHTDVDRIFVVKHTGLTALRGRVSRVWLQLSETSGDLGVGPDRFVQLSVDLGSPAY